MAHIIDFILASPSFNADHTCPVMNSICCSPRLPYFCLHYPQHSNSCFHQPFIVSHGSEPNERMHPQSEGLGQTSGFRSSLRASPNAIYECLNSARLIKCIGFIPRSALWGETPTLGGSRGRWPEPAGDHNMRVQHTIRQDIQQPGTTNDGGFG